jgi:DeoR family transcriptional regulator, fructose operon transcriptional repressor
LTTFERQQRLIEILRQQPGIRVPELARLLNVSEGTIRNDLRSLSQAGRLKRVRGGAVADAAIRIEAPAFSARARVNAEAKLSLARQAARLIDDGDTILCDASSTVYHLTHYLDDRRHLTIITNGIELARSFAAHPAHTVILLGGKLRNDAAAISGPIAERALEDLRVKTAFLSATGLRPDSGLYEVDIDEAQLKRKMIAAASSVVALIDSSKVGRVDLTLFARLDQISRLFVDDSLTPQWRSALQRLAVRLTVCGADDASTYPKGLV